ncbi:MAG: hypothetical protein BM485_00235 [Desulfobulbaceae bacterium DB1]|nr:MAG: hypothetical protein BM485_00235 [Desulfobulbaceae bacterium DB1]
MNRNPIFFPIIVSFIALLLFCGEISAQEVSKKSIALLPVQSSGSKDISYLQTGIRSMLASRLAAEAGVTVVDLPRVDQAAAAAGQTSEAERAAKTGSALQADFALACTLTAIGNSLSLDAKLYPVSSQGQIETFYASAASENEIIGAVDSLAWDIAEKSFGKQRPVPKFAQQAQMQQPVAAQPGEQPMLAPALPTGQPQGENPAYMTAHPDRQFMGSHGGMNPAPIMFPTAINGPFGFTKTQNLNFSMQALDVGDIDGDGQLDVAIAEKNKVTVYHLVNNRLVPFGEITTLSRNKIIALNLADINGNGKAEIYVTGVDWITPDSLGAEWQDKDFTYLFKNERWYVRPLYVPGPGLVLAGQRPAMDAAFAPGIYQIRVTESILQQEEKLPVPDSITIYDFSMADLDGDGKIEIIALDDSDKLLVMQSGGKQIWKSDESFGGTLSYVGGDDPRAQSNKDIHDTRTKDRRYIHSRIIIDDINNDNQPDIIINKNLSTASKVLKNLKNYPTGEMHALAWNGIGLTELWRTRKIDGYVSSYQFIHDKEKEGPATLFVGVVMNSGWSDVFAAKDSTVLIYPLDLAKMQQQMEAVPQGYQYMGQ